jgi:hypothetical protein
MAIEHVKNAILIARYEGWIKKTNESGSNPQLLWLALEKLPTTYHGPGSH